MLTVKRLFRQGLFLLLDRRGIWLVLPVAAACYALSFNPRLSGTDMAAYLVTAQALATGQGFCKANLVGCPPETYYPPGFPLLLAPFVALLPGWPANVFWLTLVPLALGLLSLPLIYRLLKEELPAFPLPLLITLAVAVSYVGTWFTFVLMSETLYALVSVAALLALHRAERSVRSLPVYALAGLLIGALALVRTTGLALLAGALAYLFLKRKWKSALAVLAPAMVLVLPVFVRAYLAGQSPTWAPYRGVFIVSYLDTFLQKHWQDTTLGRATLADLAHRLLVNVQGQGTESLPKLLFPTLISPRLHDLLKPLRLEWLVSAFSWLAAGATVVGFGLRLRQRLRPLELYVLFYMAMILLPGWYTFRNLLPILPFIYLYIASFLASAAGPLGAALGRRRLAPRLGLVLSILFVLLSAASNMLSQVGTNFEMGAHFRASGAPYVESPSFVEACAWIRDHTRPGDRVVYRSSEKIYLCSGRQAPPSLSTMPVSLNGRDHAVVIAAVYQEADYVLVGAEDVVAPALTNSEPVDFQSTYFLHGLLEQDSESFRLSYETVAEPAIWIYQVLRGGE